MKTRNLTSTPNAARRLLDEAIKLYVSNNAAPMVRRARETFHNREVCAEDGWLFGDVNDRAGQSDVNTQLIGYRILLPSAGSFGTVWSYHPKHKVWKVQLEPLDALNYQDIDEGDFEECGIERAVRGGFAVRHDRVASGKLVRKLRSTAAAKRPRTGTSTAVQHDDPASLPSSLSSMSRSSVSLLSSSSGGPWPSKRSSPSSFSRQATSDPSGGSNSSSNSSRCGGGGGNGGEDAGEDEYLQAGVDEGGTVGRAGGPVGSPPSC